MRFSGLVFALTCLVAPLPTAAADTPRAKLSTAELASRIDASIAAKYKAHGVIPAPSTADGELVRRLYLDLNGRIPDILAARDFADNPAKDKREQLIDQLLASDRYAVHFANVWRAWILPDSSDPQTIVPRSQPRILFARPVQEQHFLGRDGAGDGFRPGRRPEQSRRARPGEPIQAGRHGGDDQPVVPGSAARMRPVSQPPLRPLAAQAVLGVRRLLHRPRHASPGQHRRGGLR